MNTLFEILKKSYHYQNILIMDDFFSYLIKPEKQIDVIEHLTSILEKHVNTNAYLEILDNYHDLSIHDALVDLNMIYRTSRCEKHLKEHIDNQKDIALFDIFHTWLSQCSKDASHRYIGLIKTINQEVIIESKRWLLQDALKDINHHVYIVVRSFDRHMLYHLDHKVDGFIYQHEPSLYDQWLAEMYNVKLIHISGLENLDLTINNHDKPHGLEVVNIYMSIVDTRQVVYSNETLFSGVVFYSELMYLTKGMIIDEEDVYETFASLCKHLGQKHMYVIMPGFNDLKKKMIHDDTHINVDRFTYVYKAMMSWVKGLAKMINRYHPNITLILPHMNSCKDITLWKEDIDVLLSHIEDPSLLPIGMTLETEASLQYCEDFKGYQSVIIKLDELIDEYKDDGEKKIGDDDLLFLIDDMRHAHFIYRVKQPKKHLISGEMLSDYVFLRKTLTMGFRDFVVSYHQLDKIIPVFRDWEASRGKNKKMTQ